MFKTISKMPVSQDGMPDTKSQTNMQNDEINLCIKHEHNASTFAINNRLQQDEKNNHNFNNNSVVSNKRRIDEGHTNNGCNSQLNKKLKVKHEGCMAAKEKTNEVCIVFIFISLSCWKILSCNFKLVYQTLTEDNYF